MSGNGERVKKKVIETASDVSASGKEVEPGEKEENEKDVTEALLVFEKIQIEEKTSLEDMTEQDVGEEHDVLKGTSIEYVELGKEAETEEVTKAAEEKDDLVNETEIFVASIPVQKEEERA